MQHLYGRAEDILYGATKGYRYMTIYKTTRFAEDKKKTTL